MVQELANRSHSGLIRRRHKFKHPKHRTVISHPETYSEHVVFSIFCYVQLFFAMVSVVLAFNTGALGLTLGFSIAWGLTGLLGLLVALNASQRGLIVFICLQVVCFGIELHAFLHSLMAEAGEECTGTTAHKGTLIIVTEKLYTFFFIGGACLAADHLRTAIQVKSQPDEESAEGQSRHNRDISNSITSLGSGDGLPAHIPDHIPLEFLDQVNARLVATGSPPLDVPPDLAAASSSSPGKK